MAYAHGSLSLLPNLPAYAEARAKQLGLRRNELLAVLLHNYLHGPSIAVPPPEKLGGKWKRVRMQASMPGSLRREGKRAAARWKLSFSGLMEALLIVDATNDRDPLTIHPVKGMRKPPFEFPS